MCQTHQDNSLTSNLAEDILILILVRLSLRSLLRFSCVSKSWHALITSQEFAKLHLNRSLTHSTPQLLMFRETNREGPHRRLMASKNFQKRPSLHPLKGDLSEPQNLAFNEIQFGDIFETKPYYLVGSCNGLLCFWECNSKTNPFVLRNPLTRSYWTLPDPLASDGIYSWNSFAGFGYDDVHDEYKVVRFFDRKGRYDVEVYGLKSNSWKTVVDDLRQDDFRICHYGGVLVDCTLHWLCIENSILAIDLRTEKHRILLRPKSHPRWYSQLSTLNGCLCLTLDTSDGRSIILLILKDHKVDDSWTKIAVQVQHVPGFTRPVMHLEGEKIVVFQNGVEIIWYDQVQQRVTFKTEIPSSPASFFEGMIPFVGSLVEPWSSNGKRM